MFNQIAYQDIIQFISLFESDISQVKELICPPKAAYPKVES